MVSTFKIAYLVNTNSYQRVQDLFKSLCNLDIELLDAESKLIPLSKTNKTADQSTGYSFYKVRFQGRKTEPNTDEPRIPLHTLEYIFESKKIKILRNIIGLRKIIVPIVVRDDVLGFLLVEEKPDARLLDPQIQSIANFLKGTVNQIITDELKSFEGFQGKPITHQRKMIDKATEYIKQNYHHPDLSLAKLSDQHGISTFYLSRLFKKEINTTFSSFLKETRIKAATHLLKNRNMTISQISYACGFDDPGYFSKVFKRTTEYTPATYRAKSSTARKSRHTTKTQIDRVSSLYT